MKPFLPSLAATLVGMMAVHAQPITVETLLMFHKDLKAADNVSELYIGKGGKHGFCNGRNPKNPFFYWSDMR